MEDVMAPLTQIERWCVSVAGDLERHFMIRAVAAAILAILAASCVSIGAYNARTPHDAGVVHAASNVNYGEGSRRTLDVYVPEARPTRAPVIVFFYGGGWSSGAKGDYTFAGDAFAAQGFVTFVPDYRVYPEVQFPGFVDDAAAAVRWVQANAERYGGDPDRIVLVGHSAGAHIAMLTALDPHYAEQASFDRSAIRGVVGLAGAYGFDNFNVPLLRNVFGSAEDPMTTMPVHYARREAPPILLLHGERDRRVPVRSSSRMYAVASSAGQQAEIKIYPGVDHPGIMQALAIARRDEAPVLEDVVTFARRVTGVHVAESAPTPAGAH
jgi:acetyl esterase/lipase